MRIAIITVAGVSSRFNEGIAEEEKRHKIIYYENDTKHTLLYHLVEKCMYADRIVLVGGSRYSELEAYCAGFPEEMRSKILLTYNPHYEDLASGYSLYVGLDKIFSEFEDVEDILFVEGDLDIDRASFNKVVQSDCDVLTYSFEPIYANKAVVLYKDTDGHYKYAFNSSHGALKIDDAFTVILNSGQMWKFKDAKKLKVANDKFYETEKDGTNLRIIQNYIDSCDNEGFELIGLSRWTNCNTREDYRKILKYWEEEEP